MLAWYYAASPCSDHRRIDGTADGACAPLRLDQRLDPREHLRFAQRHVETLGWGRALAEQQVDRRRVTRLDLGDAPRRCEHLLALQRRRGAVVGADTGVLEHRRERHERALVVRGYHERRFRNRLATERFDRRGERLYVILLLFTEHRRVGLRRAT